LKGSPVSLKRWHRQRRERIVYSDIRDLESVKEISNLEILIDALPDRVGSPLSRKNLSQDLNVDFKTIEHWLTILENVYYAYRVRPFLPLNANQVKSRFLVTLLTFPSERRFQSFIKSTMVKTPTPNQIESIFCRFTNFAKKWGFFKASCVVLGRLVAV
jgi:hypothetical protein